MAGNIGDAEIVIGADASGVGSEVESQVGKELSKSSERLSKGFSAKFSSGMKAVGRTSAQALGATLTIGTAAVATGVGAVLGKAISSGMGRLAAIDTAQAQLRGLGKSSEQVESIMSQVNDAVMGTYFSTADMAGAASLLLTSGVEEGAGLEQALEGVKGVAAATGTELGDVTGIWQKMAAQGKVTGKEMYQMTNMGLNAAAALADFYGVTQEEADKMVTAGKVSFEDFNEAIIASTGEMAGEIAKSYEGMKVSLEGWVGLVGEQLTKPFFEFGKKVLPAVEDVVSQMPAAFEEGMLPVMEVMDRLGDKVADFLGGIDIGEGIPAMFKMMADNANLIIPALTGAMAALGPLLSNIPVLGNLFRGLSGPVGIVIGLFITMFKESEILRDAFSNIMSTLGTVFASLEPAFNAVSDIIGSVAGTLGDILGSAINSVLPLVESLAGVIGGGLGKVLDAVVPLLDEVGSVILGALVSALESVMPPLIQIVDAMLPPLMALLDALIPVIVTLVETGLKVFSTVLQALLPVLGTIIEAALPIFLTLMEALTPVIEALLPLFLDLVEYIMPFVDILLDMLIPVVEALLPVVETVFSAIGDIVSSVMSIVEGVINTVMGVIEGDWSKAWEGIKQVFSGIWDAIKSILKAAWNIVKSVIKAGLDLIKALWDGVWNGIKQLFSSVWNSIKSIGSSAINAVMSTISGVLNSIKATWDRIWNGIKSFFSNIWDGIKSGASSGINAVWDTVTGIKDRILGFFRNAGTWLIDAGKKILQGLTNGIKSALSGPVDAVKGGIAKIRNLLPFSPAKEGPFSGRGYPLYSGATLMDAFAEGIEGQIRNLQRTAARAMQAAHGALSAPRVVPVGVTPVMAPARPQGPSGASAVASTGGGDPSRESMDYLAERVSEKLADKLWPMARSADIVGDLAMMGPNRRRRGGSR